ncbi:hypothetical protein KKH23_08385 [Patescibacteria group bacterium]|uniref:Uncharacterized protein n=1 Tax=viral metagenome TaxID=1070528 RepID=A0A6M3M2X8_9ZZZZ|nr:hypothetical protein [Patescibacteria group bacterium]MBU0847184.1 hypothetical protein [Patescibacteria group bacterium]
MEKNLELFKDANLGIAVPKEKPKPFNLDKAIEDLAGVFCDPIIVYGPSGWATPDMIPPWLRERITMDRLLMNLRHSQGEEMTGTDSEALAYMIPVSFEHPMGHDWSQIYLHLATKVMEGEPSKVIPDDIRVDKLDRGQEADLRHLKCWLYDQKVKHRSGARSEMKKERAEEASKKRKEAQPELFEF